MTQVHLEFLADGIMKRKDGNGNIFKFAPMDIKNFEIDYDGVIGNLLFKCGANEACINYEAAGGTNQAKTKFCVISFKPGSDVQRVQDLFKKLQEAIRK